METIFGCYGINMPKMGTSLGGSGIKMPKFVTILWLVLILCITVVSGEVLQCGNCTRIDINKLDCPNSYDPLRIKITIGDHKLSPNSVMKMQCRATAENLNLEFFQGCQFPEIRYIQFQYCPFPQEPFREILRSLGIEPETLISLSFSDVEQRYNQTINSDSLNGLYDLKNIEFKSNLLPSLPKDLFQDNSQLEFISITYNNMGTIPEDLFRSTPNLTELYLRGNKLHSIPEYLLYNLTKLQNLSLYENDISEIPLNFLSTTPKLSTLELSYNKLTSLNPHVFSKLQNLNKLNLYSNQIQSIPGTLLQNCIHLEKIDISYNSLKSIPGDLFKSTKSLSEILFDKNQVTEIPEGIFSDLRNLTKLKIKRNGLISFPSDSFSNLINLEVLDLQSNRISNLPKDCFKDLTNLKELILYNNSITELPLNIFKPLESLEKLYVSRNKLKRIESASFPHPISILEHLDLSYNYLSFTETSDANDESFENSGHYFSTEASLTESSIGEMSSTEASIESSISESRTQLSLTDASLTELSSTDASLTELSSTDASLTELSSTEASVTESSSADASLTNERLTDTNLTKSSSTESSRRESRSTKSHINLAFQEQFPLASQINLVELDLSFNQIPTIPQSLVTDFPHLKDLNLKGNQIEYLHRSQLRFEHIRGLRRRIDLTYNQIRTIDLGEYSEFNHNNLQNNLNNDLGNHNGENIQISSDFNQNNLEHNLDEYNGNYLQISINNNPLICDCQLYNLIKVVQRDLFKTSFVRDYLYVGCTRGEIEASNQLSQSKIKTYATNQPNNPNNQSNNPNNQLNNPNYQPRSSRQSKNNQIQSKTTELLMYIDLSSLTCQIECIYSCICLRRTHDQMLIVDCSNRGLREIPRFEVLNQFVNQGMKHETNPDLNYETNELTKTNPNLSSNQLKNEPNQPTNEQNQTNQLMNPSSSSNQPNQLSPNPSLSSSQLNQQNTNSNQFNSKTNPNLSSPNEPNSSNHLRSPWKLQNHSITLNLNENNITTLDGLQYYKNLVNLTITHNKLVTPSIKENYIPMTLKYLDLRWNAMTSLEESVLMYLNATTLRLGGNPWKCDCELLPLFDFIRDPASNVTDAERMGCVNVDVPLVKALKEDLCPLIQQARVIIPIISATVIIFIILVALTVFIYRCQYDIKVWLFSHGLFIWAIKHEEQDYYNKKYDAFISYSNKDDEFVNKILVPGLEPKYKLCLHYRDWIPGDYIQNQIDQSIESSRRTIVILSKNFLENVWGQIEFKTAHSKALKNKTNNIIVIVYEELPEDTEMDEELKLYLSTRTYLLQRDPKFWDKLHYAMPHQTVYRRNKHLKQDTLELKHTKL